MDNFKPKKSTARKAAERATEFMFRITKYLTQKMRDMIDSSVAAENRSLERKIENVRSSQAERELEHRREVRELKTEIEILTEKLKVHEETMRLQQIALKGEYERRKAEIAAHMRQQEFIERRQFGPQSADAGRG